jgi:Tetratricopeptide repeat
MRHLLTIAGVVVLLLVPAAQVHATKPVVPAPKMKVDQARQAVMDAAKLLFVSINKRTYQGIDTKSMRVSVSSAEFNSEARSRGGRHHYTIRFAAFDFVSAECDSMDCTTASNPPGTLALDETGRGVETVLFTDVYGKRQYKSTCSAECHEIAMDFAAALNSLHHLALARQGLLGPGFHEKAADWRALATKPPLPDNVRLQRLLAEDALKNHQPGEALHYYEAGLKLYPAWPQGWFNAALISAQLGSYADAAEDMQAYLELVPDAKDAQSARDQIAIWQYKAKHSSTN